MTSYYMECSKCKKSYKLDLKKLFGKEITNVSAIDHDCINTKAVWECSECGRLNSTVIGLRIRLDDCTHDVLEGKE